MAVLRNRWHRGATLLEVIVVIAIIGVAIALTAAGVQKIRASAASAACQNNARQVAMATHGFLAVHGNFPAGAHFRFDPTYPHSGDHGFGWLSSILPQLGLDALYRNADEAYSLRIVNRLPAPNPERTIVTSYVCPATGMATYFDGDDNWAVTYYLGVSGTNFFANDGLLHSNASFRPADCLDGLSNTLLLGERPPGDFGAWFTAHGFGRATYGQLLPVQSEEYQPWRYRICSTDRDPLRPGTLSDPCDTGHFWSLHPGGATFAFGDGSVKFLSYSACSILPSLATRSGGEVEELP